MEDEDFGLSEETIEEIDGEDNRIRNNLSDLNNRTNDQEEMMLEIMEVLNKTVTPVPDPGRAASEHNKFNLG